MEDFLQFLKENAYVWAGILILTVVLSSISIIQNNKKKRLLFLSQTNYLVKKSVATIKDLSISYANEIIDDLSISKIALVNSGNVTISSDDIAIASPLIIKGSENCRILSAGVVVESNESSMTEVKLIDSNRIEISFDYFDKKDGALFQIIHTGKGKVFDYTGKIKGGKIIAPSSETETTQIKTYRKYLGFFSKLEFMFSVLSIALALLVLFGLLLLFGIIDINKFTVIVNDPTSNTIGFLSAYFSMLFIYSITWVFAFNQMRKRKYILPKALREYYNQNY